MPKILNLAIVDNHNPENPPSIFIESFQYDDGIQDPEKALRDAIREFINSDTEDAKKAKSYSCQSYNWGDAMSSVPDNFFVKHGLVRLNQNAVDVFVDHDEILCETEQPDE